MAGTVAGIHLGLDVHGSRPAANTVPDSSFYSCSTHSLIYKSNYAGNSWATWANLSGSGMADPMTTRGDMIIRNASNTTDRLGRGSARQVLASDGTDIGWVSTELDYVQVTSDTNITATTEATANTIVTGSAVAYDGSTIVIIEFWCNHAGPTATGGTNDVRFWLYDGSSSIGFIAYYQQDQASGQRQYAPIIGRRRITPSNATHTYSVRASVSAATGLVAAGAGGSGNVAPAYIRITRA
jgi:hypothetical protein